MSTSLEDLKVLQEAEAMADAVWKQVISWDEFARDVVGKQLTRAIDSIGANIAESFGRFNYGEKLQFLYYARGSLFETKYWLNRVQARALMQHSEVARHILRLTTLARQLNAFAASIKSQCRGDERLKTVHEEQAEYAVWSNNDLASLFDDQELNWLETISIT